MKLNSTLLDDIGRVANGAASALFSIRDQVRSNSMFTSPSMASASETVSRAEFDAVAAMAAKARDVQEQLLERVTALEQELARRQGGA